MACCNSLVGCVVAVILASTFTHSHTAAIGKPLHLQSEVQKRIFCNFIGCRTPHKRLDDGSSYSSLDTIPENRKSSADMLASSSDSLTANQLSNLWDNTDSEDTEMDMPASLDGALEQGERSQLMRLLNELAVRGRGVSPNALWRALGQRSHQRYHNLHKRQVEA